MSRSTKTKPGAGRRRVSGAIAGLKSLHGNSKSTGVCRAWQSLTLPKNWRDRVPDAADYYPQHLGKLTRCNEDGWAQGKCPFHDDRSASLSVQAAGRHGGWRCFAGCGKGDIVAFHMRLRGLGFKEAVCELMRGGA